MKIKDNLEKQFYRIRISEDDFREALEYLKEYEKYKFNIINKALLSMAIIGYSRPFVKSSDGAEKGQSVLNVRLRDIYDESEIELHKNIISYRHKAIAHSDYENRAFKIIKSDGNGFVIGGMLFDIQSELIDVKKLMSMCKKMLKHCVGRMFEVNNKLQSLGFEP
jgi:hypothetical protein